MPTDDVLLVDAGSLVVSGAAIALNAVEHTMNLDTYWTVPDVPGKSTGSSYNIRLAQGKYQGISNPVHSITGVYDDTGKSYTQDLAGNGYYYMTGSMLKGIAMSGSMFALIDPHVNKASGFGNGSMVYVVCTNYKVSRDPSSDLGSGSRGYLVNYSINLKEIQV